METDCRDSSTLASKKKAAQRYCMPWSYSWEFTHVASNQICSVKKDSPMNCKCKRMLIELFLAYRCSMRTFPQVNSQLFITCSRCLVMRPDGAVGGFGFFSSSPGVKAFTVHHTTLAAAAAYCQRGRQAKQLLWSYQMYILFIKCSMTLAEIYRPFFKEDILTSHSRKQRCI